MIAGTIVAKKALYMIYNGPICMVTLLPVLESTTAEYNKSGRQNISVLMIAP